jgi:hypothetical protein
MPVPLQPRLAARGPIALPSEKEQQENAMVHPDQIRIMQLGSGWYWEVVTYDREVIARGLADTHAQARQDAGKASSVSSGAEVWAA